MDKNKSRTDMLAAGRKKLQQFRQKKDGKGSGSQGKSLKKSGKSEQREVEAEVESGATEAASLSLVPEQESASHGDSEPPIVVTSTSRSTENVAPDIAVSVDDISAVSSSQESGVVEPLKEEMELSTSMVEVGVHNVDFIEKDELMHTIGVATSEMGGITPMVGSDTTNSKVETAFNESVLISSAAQPLSVDSTGVYSEDNVLALQEDVPGTSLGQARGDQEADGLEERQSNYSSELELGGDTEVFLPNFCKTAEAFSGASLAETSVNKSSETEQAETIDEVSLLDVTETSNDLSGAALASDEAGVSSISSSVENQQYEGKPEQPSGKDDAQDVAGDGSAAQDYNQQHELDDSEKLRGIDVGTPAGTRVVSVPELSSLSLSQLINLLRGLSEEEFGRILESRRPVSGAELGTGNMLEVDDGFRHLLERLKEELVLTNLSNEISQMQLAQQSELQGDFANDRCRLVDEIALLKASLKESNEKTQCLTEELSGCKYELQAVVSAREELQIQFHTSQADVQELSGRTNELQMSLERSKRELLNLTVEFDDCKQLVRSLQSETEILNGNIASVTEDRDKLREEKDFQFGEIEKLLTELADCKASLAALHSENSNLTTSFSSLAGQRQMLLEEKEKLRDEHEKLSNEFAECKGLASILQKEKSSLIESLDLITEEREKLEADKRDFAQENKRLTSELLVFQEKIYSEQRERERVEVELKEMSMRLEEIIEENIFLSSSLEVHKAKLLEDDSNRLKMSLQSSEDVHQVEISVQQSKNREFTAAGEDSSCDQEQQVDRVFSSLVEKKPLSDGSAGQSLLDQELPAGFFCFHSFRVHLEEAEKTLHQLEKANEGVQSHSLSFGKSGSKSSAPGVSKLIQAFESKVITDEQEAEPLTEKKLTTADPFGLMKEQIGKLKTVVKQLVVDAADAYVLYNKECDSRRTADICLGELKAQYEALKDHSNSLEATNIELLVLCEVVKQHGGSVEAMNNELAVSSEVTKQEVVNLKVENTQLGLKLRAYESRIGELQNECNDLQQTSNEMVAMIGNRMEALGKDVSERVLVLEQDWNSTISQIVEIVQKLTVSTGNLTATSLVPDEVSNVVSYVAASVNETIKMIEDHQQKLEAARTDYEEISTSFKKVNHMCDELQQKNDLAAGTLQNIHFQLIKLVNLHGSIDESEMKVENEKVSDPLDYSIYGVFIEQLEDFLIQRLELESVTKKLHSELIERRMELDELERGCLRADNVCKLIESFEGVLKPEVAEMHLDELPTSRFEALASTLVQKYKEAHEKLSSSKEEFGSIMMKSTELQEEIQQLIATRLQHETEISVLKESLNQAEEALFSSSSELQKKTSELEQSEQRVSSIREKLSIAVAKGKGLIVQRDGLRQSLEEISGELERYKQELQLKDARLHEVEVKLKTYSEAGERVEALESELSYIRNSATGLRESFLLKDSVLQRIEEILEDLDLPEQFHSSDILEKVEWLARSASANPLPTADWDQKSSAGGGSYSETGFVMMEPWKEDAQSSSNSVEDLKRRHEELQSKFYGIAEQNEMLEQSLLERNNLVQKWEELLDQIDMPAHLRSLEPEDRIQWLGRALSDAHHDAISLQEKVVNLENYCGSLNADLKYSQKMISDLETNIETITGEKDYLSEKLEILSHDYDKISAVATHFELEKARLQSEVTRLEESHAKLSAKEADFELEKKRLQNEVTHLQESVAEMLGIKEQILNMEGAIRRLQSLIIDALQDPEIQDQVSSGSSTEGLEMSLKKLLENYANFSEKHVLSRAADVLQNDVMMIGEAKIKGLLDAGDSDIAVLKKELDEAMKELIYVKGERDMYVEKQQSLACEIEALVKRREELELLLSQEEQRSASVREKLNVAVRKGKSVVQQRDSLKQTVEVMNADMENLKSKINIQESKLSDYEKRFTELSSYPEKVEVLEFEVLSLRNYLTKTEQQLQETGDALSLILNSLAAVDVGDGVESADPIEKLGQIVKLCQDMHADLISSEEESRKSKRAAELLLAELNEVQERNDNLQEELANSTSELSKLTNERNAAEAATLEANSRLKELYNGHSMEQRNQFSELKALKSGVDQLKKGFRDVSNQLADMCSKDLEFLDNLEKSIGMSLNPTSSTDVLSIPAFNVGHRSGSSDSKGIFASIDSWLDSNVHGEFDSNSVSEICGSVGLQLEELMVELGVLKENLQKHSSSLHERASSLSKSMVTAQRELISQNEFRETMNREIVQIESAAQEKNNEIVMLHKNFSFLVESLSGLITEIQSKKAELFGNDLASGDIAMNLKSYAFSGEGISGGAGLIQSEESITTMTDKLLFTVRDFANVKAEIVEVNQKQMRIAIADLQKELQEKEIQKERICMDLVSQIKVAEAAASRYSSDLQSCSRRANDLENRLKQVERERDLLEQKTNELLDVQATTTELQQWVASLTDVIAAKDQEIEALMQALDEEESQMEEHVKKIEELEQVLQQKNLDLENVESSRGKVMKKLSITVSKFDELHQLSASLLAEVEKLQLQLQDRDAEVSFLRQEVTRCTNEVLVASQLSNTIPDDILEFSAWFDMIIASVGMQNIYCDVKNSNQVQEHKELLKKKIESVISELVDLREVAQSKDALLQVERGKVDELARKEEILRRSLRDKESRLNLLEGVGTSEGATGMTSEIMEVEPLINKWTVPGPSVTSQVRSLRKANTDQVAIAIDMDTDGGNRLEDEDDDKVHGFKSLTTSRVIPRFTRPVSDMVDGLWVSCDRALMRQPALRLGIMIYWAVLHALLATLAF